MLKNSKFYFEYGAGSSTFEAKKLVVKFISIESDKKIFETKENIRVLQERHELVMLEYNYLTSPKKLMEYQKKYFDNELLEADIQSLNWIEIENKDVKIKKILSNNE